MSGVCLVSTMCVSGVCDVCLVSVMCVWCV